MSALGRGLIIWAALQPKPKRGRGRPRKHPLKGIRQTLLGEGLIVRGDGTIDVKRKRGERKRVPRHYSEREGDQIASAVQARREEKGLTERAAILDLLKEGARELWDRPTKPTVSTINEIARRRLPAIQMLLARRRRKK